MSLWQTVTLTLYPKDLELSTAALYDLGVESFQIVDNTLTEADKQAMFVDLVPEDLDQEGSPIGITCYFSPLEPVTQLVAQIQTDFKGYGIEILDITLGENDEATWANKWKDYYKPFKVGKNLVIRPIWEPYGAKVDDVVITLDPGMAFGSGTHETTAMCAKAIETYIKPGDQVLDVGCGSGILSIIAAKLGAGHVLGVDIDPNAVKIARENTGHNDLTQVQIEQGDLLTLAKGPYDLVLANILAEVIVLLSDQVVPFMKPGAHLVTSGIILEKIKDVENALKKAGLTLVTTVTEGEWAAVIACRPEV